MITKDKIIQIQDKWSSSMIKISSFRDNYKLCLQYTDVFLNELYAFDVGIVLFKPTQANDEQFRFTKEKALSYFIAGEKKVCQEDSGFALHPWKQITFNNLAYNIENNIAFVMGNYYFTDLNDIDLKVEYTFGYKLINEKMKIILQHSSLPFNK
tara:strand:+ start:337 stop:798 length:462 start_codon:yes stop_codon:yes gene_type:complete